MLPKPSQVGQAPSGLLNERRRGSGSANWMPLWRKEISYSGTLALTKIFPKHEVRAGMDFVRYELNHDQAEWGNYGLKGGFSFANNTTGAVGYTSPGWNSFAATQPPSTPGFCAVTVLATRSRICPYRLVVAVVAKPAATSYIVVPVPGTG